VTTVASTVVSRVASTVGVMVGASVGETAAKWAVLKVETMVALSAALTVVPMELRQVVHSVALKVASMAPR
jgi:predicted Co/Zn/Cd cation transporter (cation efflux family)